MHKNGRKYFSCDPQFSESQFPSDSRGGLRFAVGRRLAGLLDLNVRHPIRKKVRSDSVLLKTDRLGPEI